MSANQPLPPGVLFYEQGASWVWLLAGPAAAAAIVAIQLSTGVAVQPVVAAIFLALVSGFLALQVKAARVHASVELTADTLREGAETIRVDQIVTVFPAPARGDTPHWQSARPLGELSGVPRGRTPIGLKLTGDRTAQAWARRHAELRAALTRLLDERAA